MTYQIYSVRSKDNIQIKYYGFTKNKFLSKLLYDYKSKYKRYQKNCDNYLNVFELFKYNNVYIKSEETIDSDNKEHIKNILNNYISNNDCLNKQIIHFENNNYTNQNIYINEQLYTDLSNNIRLEKDIEKDIEKYIEKNI